MDPERGHDGTPAQRTLGHTLAPSCLSIAAHSNRECQPSAKARGRGNAAHCPGQPSMKLTLSSPKAASARSETRCKLLRTFSYR